MINETLKRIPDNAKIATAVSSSVLTFFGIPVEQWMYTLSAIVSILFIIEKTPKAIESIKQVIRMIKGASS